MLKQIKSFHKLVKIKSKEGNLEGETPITFIKVFRKEYPRMRAIVLPEVKKSELEKLAEKRYSTREFSDEPLNLEDMTKLLNSCKILDIEREPERRTYPSAGARFPIELYVVSYNVNGLDKGAYHYNIHKNILETLWIADLDSKKEDLISSNLENPAATIVMTSVLSRSEIKYWYKAFPFSYIEAGHMGQNIVLSAAENNIGACPVSGFVDDTITEILDLTEGEIPVYTISVGKKK